MNGYYGEAERTATPTVLFEIYELLVYRQPDWEVWFRQVCQELPEDDDGVLASLNGLKMELLGFREAAPLRSRLAGSHISNILESAPFQSLLQDGCEQSVVYKLSSFLEELRATLEPLPMTPQVRRGSAVSVRTLFDIDGRHSTESKMIFAPTSDPMLNEAADDAPSNRSLWSIGMDFLNFTMSCFTS